MVQDRVRDLPALAQLDAQDHLKDAGDQAAQAEQQREGDRAET
jgi:hypothetical protein